MNCPVCDSAEVTIRSTRPEKEVIHRRRVCGRCGHRWNTAEISQMRLDKLNAIERHAAHLADAIAEE